LQILDFRFELIVKVSIIIVSYNVKYFLEQCLSSVMKAIREWSVVSGELEAEVLVVDNNSADGSIGYLESRFPSAHFIANKENTGFAKANNQALQTASGKYILFLNPDTILPEDFFARCLQFMEANPHAGAAGVQMIDGTGRFLKESKRGFPTSWASFCKLFGLTSLFPTAKVFSKYYLGYLDENTNHEVEALSGACMLVRREVVHKTGGFDELFFMYAEDIDLSLRIHQSGYKNVYLAETTIIHFKGESTTKDSRYVKLFYKAMIQFVEKHYTGFTGSLFARLLKLAIWSRALFSFGKVHLKKPVGKQSTGQKIFFAGNSASIDEIKKTELTEASLAHSAHHADEIIWCEGKGFPFKKIIDEIKRMPNRNHRIHAAGTSGVTRMSR